MTHPVFAVFYTGCPKIPPLPSTFEQLKIDNWASGNVCVT